MIFINNWIWGGYTGKLQYILGTVILDVIRGLLWDNFYSSTRNKTWGGKSSVKLRLETHRFDLPVLLVMHWIQKTKPNQNGGIEKYGNWKSSKRHHLDQKFFTNLWVSCECAENKTGLDRLYFCLGNTLFLSRKSWVKKNCHGLQVDHSISHDPMYL